MGVPSFYRWLVNKYPKIVCNAVEEKGDNSTRPNPNGLEFDNFYLDMNGIIHPCFHPDDNLFSPTTYEEVFKSIFEYIDQLFNIVRPRKLLFLAIDGVAPRAKMNQQRARRFRNAKDIQMANEMEEKLRKEFVREGKAVLPKEESQVADSNVITPGTEFMNILSKQLQSYISRRMNDSPAWASIKVILSNDTVPGEGEHKIMSFIRAQRSLPGYDPNTRHCLYGLDADLIMLALATHEIHFSILREEVLAPENQLSLGNKENPWQKSKSKTISESKDLVSCKKDVWGAKKVQPYQFLNIWILREYLALDLQVTCEENFECDFERIIDDFIFICFFAGNDFLPHMPSLSIHEGCLDLMMHVYKKEFQNLGGYLVDITKVDDKNGGFMKLKRIERFILMVGSHEEKIFSKRSQIRDKKLRRILNEYRDAKKCEMNDVEDERVSDVAVSCHVADAHGEMEVCASDVDIDTLLSNTKDLKQRLKDYIRDQSDLFKDGGLGTDKVKFGTPGWRERYYDEKFGAQTAQDIEATRKDVVAKYGEGLCWVLLYYFSGVPSWTWFYPYHYAPLASDLKGLSRTNLKFQKGLPFKPFVQLLGVLPPMSVHALPLAYKGLMIDDNSNIIDFYPTEFETDTDGKRFTWQGISKLPFIEEERLLTETKKLENELKEYEKTRNSESLDRLFLSYASKESQLVLQNGTKTASKKIKDAIAMESPMEGIKGTIHLMPEDLIEADDNNNKGDARNDLCLFYEIDRGCRLVPRLLERVNIPEKTVTEDDIVETTLWHEAGYGNRFHNQRPVKPEPEHKWEPRSQNPNPAFISKGAGRGFSLGRGKPSFSQTSSSQLAYNERSSTGFVMRNDYNRDFQGLRISGSSPRPMSNNNNQPRWQGRGGNCVAQSAYNEGSSAGFMMRNDYNRDFQGHRMLGSNPRPMLNNNNQPRLQGRGGNFSPSGRGASEDWRSNNPSGADRTGSSWQQNYGSSTGPVRNMSTGRGRGRGWVATQN